MGVVYYIEHDTAPLPLGAGLQADEIEADPEPEAVDTAGPVSTTSGE